MSLDRTFVSISTSILVVTALLFPITEASAEDKNGKGELEKTLGPIMTFRPIGPFRGGRSCAVTGVKGRPMEYYFGSAGGGVWRTEDGGSSWDNLSDGFFGGSIGAIAVSPSNPNVIYVGGGEKTVRGNVSHGDGVWKSENGGKSWTHMGLEDSRHIARIRVDPKNPQRVFVAAMGHLYGPNQQRGVFRSLDGGKTWKRVLFVNDEVGAVDLILDPNNPRALYASTWRIKRTPYSLESGGQGSGLWKSLDGGDTWKEITRNKGLPQKDIVGIIGVAVSPADSRRVWAIIESKDGGVFRSDNGGETWAKINSDRNLRQRAWYYTRIYAGPTNKDEVYVLNVAMWRSKDGGKTYSRIRTPHSDHHDLWIDPDDSRRMIVGDDGGAQVTFNAGKTWSSYHNQPTAQFYRVTTDNVFPYRIYGAQQDNSTVRIPHRVSGWSIGERDWESTAGGESGHIAPSPKDPDIVYGGSYGGYLTRYNHKTKEIRNVHIWPDNPMGYGAGKLKYRFQWNFPIFFSPHDPKTLYAAANVLFKTTNEGQTWTAVSPDLTRNDKRKQGPSGGPITKDNTSVEYYCTIFAALESPHERGVLWSGSDDGLVHLSRDGGKNWKNVTPPTLPEWSQINSMEAHPTIKGGLYLAATRYKLDDFQPLLFKTLDYGKSWTQINKGIHRKHFTRVIRADPKRAGLLYAGTENGLYLSLNDGKSWQRFQLNLPQTPITDLAWKNDDLIVATQGRSFWVLDDLTPLHQYSKKQLSKALHLFQPRPSYRMRGGGSSRPPRTAGQNAPSGLVAYYFLKEKVSQERAVTIEILDASGQLIRKYSTKPDKKKKIAGLKVKVGLNRFQWNYRYNGAERFDGLVLWGGGTSGPKAVPGVYQLKVSYGKVTESVPFEILKDPRIKTTPEQFQAQFKTLLSIRDKLSEVHLTIKKIRKLRAQIAALKARLPKKKTSEKKTESAPAKKGDSAKIPNSAKAGKKSPLELLAQEMLKKLDAIEKALYQTKNRSPQDPLNYPIKLNNRLSALGSAIATGDNPPTDQALQLKAELTKAIDKELGKFKSIAENDVKTLNELVHKAKVPFVSVDD